MRLMENIKYYSEIGKSELHMAKVNAAHGLIKAKQAVGDMRYGINPLQEAIDNRKFSKALSSTSAGVLKESVYFRVIKCKELGFNNYIHHNKYLFLFDTSRNLIVPNLNPQNISALTRAKKGCRDIVWYPYNPPSQVIREGLRKTEIRVLKSLPRVVKFDGKSYDLENLNYDSIEILKANNLFVPVEN